MDSLEFNEKIEIIDPKDKINKERIDKYSNILFKKLKRKGKTLDDVKRLLRGRDYFGSMMVENGDADCMLSGYSKSYPSVFLPLIRKSKLFNKSRLVTLYFLCEVLKSLATRSE